MVIADDALPDVDLDRGGKPARFRHPATALGNNNPQQREWQWHK
ncbi:hypothetical protein T261_7659 [Streptomyces lydicus]|nr:hypothetical protein T261_7659 [Streptomyces lydicus]